MTRYVHTFTYQHRPRSRKDEPRVHHRCDDAAALEILRGLSLHGLRYGESLVNAPPDRPDKPEKKEAEVRPPELHPVDLSFVGDQDLILQTTRPPMHDIPAGFRKKVLRGYTDVEQCIFDVVGQAITHCSRLQIRLQDEVAEHLLQQREGLAQIDFREAEGAPFSSLNDHRGRGPRKLEADCGETAAFLMRVESMWPGGPGLVCAFGMDGTSTLAWAYRLGHDLYELLAEPRFLVAHATTAPVPDRATTLCWARDWGFEVVLDMPLREAAPAALTPPETRDRWRDDHERRERLRRRRSG